MDFDYGVGEQGTNEIDLSGFVEDVYLLRIMDAERKNHLARMVVSQ